MKLGFKEGDMEAWYKVSTQKIAEHGGQGLLAHYNGSISLLFGNLFPDRHWDPLKFSKNPHHYWNSIEKQKSFVEAFGKEMNIKEKDYEAWYKVTPEAITERGGAGLLVHHKGSFHSLLSTVFPSHKWDPLKFPKLPPKFWSAIENQKLVLDEVERKLNFKEGDKEGWYQVSHKLLVDLGARSVLEQSNWSLPDLLMKVSSHLSSEFYLYLSSRGRCIPSIRGSCGSFHGERTAPSAILPPLTISLVKSRVPIISLLFLSIFK